MRISLNRMQGFRIAYNGDTFCLYIKNYKKKSLFLQTGENFFTKSPRAETVLGFALKSLTLVRKTA